MPENEPVTNTESSGAVTRDVDVCRACGAAVVPSLTLDAVESVDQIGYEQEQLPRMEVEGMASNTASRPVAKEIPQKYSALQEWVGLVELFAGAKRRKRELLNRGLSEETLSHFSITGQAMLKSRLDHGMPIANVTGVHKLGSQGRRAR